MINDKMQEALNQQIAEELYSAYLYLSMAADFSDKGLPGLSNWMVIQYKEEELHAMKMFDYINERGGKVTMQALKQPPSVWPSALRGFEDALKHEEYITGKINALVDLAIVEKDHAANNFLQWYVEEQVEEEATARDNVDKLRLVGDDGRGMLMLDKEMGQRVFTPPTE